MFLHGLFCCMGFWKSSRLNDEMPDGAQHDSMSKVDSNPLDN
jgi:hypothetical protein